VYGDFPMPKSVFSSRYRRFRELLIQARKDAELTQTELADRLKRPQSFVSKYENGERRLDLIEFLDVAAALNIDVATLIRDLQQVTPQPDATKT
jgi:transcriptional regulator with XRE-family HTH domain